MFNSSNCSPFTMPVQPASNGFGGFGDYGGGYGGWFWIIIILLFAWGGWGGYGGGTQGAAENYVLASDFATIQRQLSDGFASMERKGDSISNGLCDGFYAQNTTMLNGFNGVTQSIADSNYATQNAITQQTIADMSNVNALTAQITGLGNQLADCCCTSRYETATKFADLNYNIASQDCQIRQTVNDVGRNLADNQNGNTQAILAAIQSLKDDAKDEKIATLTAKLAESKAAADNAAQTAYFTAAINNAVDQLQPKLPVPAFNVPAPWNYGGCNCGGCGC